MKKILITGLLLGSFMNSYSQNVNLGCSLGMDTLENRDTVYLGVQVFERLNMYLNPDWKNTGWFAFISLRNYNDFDFEWIELGCGDERFYIDRRYFYNYFTIPECK